LPRNFLDAPADNRPTDTTDNEWRRLARYALTNLVSAVEQIARHAKYDGAAEALEEVKKGLRAMRVLDGGTSSR
jgi:hypothetical protein